MLTAERQTLPAGRGREDGPWQGQLVQTRGLLKHPCHPFRTGGDEMDATGSMASWWWCVRLQSRLEKPSVVTWDEPAAPWPRGLQCRSGDSESNPTRYQHLVSRNEVHSKRGHLPLVVQTSAHEGLRPCFLEVRQDASARMIDWARARPSAPLARCAGRRSRPEQEPVRVFFRTFEPMRTRTLIS